MWALSVIGRLLFLQAEYDCGPNDQKNLDTLQKDIQKRIDFLNENNLDSYSDPVLLEYYEIHNKIQQCLFSDHTDQYLLIAAIIAGIGGFAYLRWKMIKRGEGSVKK